MSYSLQVERLTDLVQRHSGATDAHVLAAAAQALATLQVAEELHKLRLGESSELTLTVYRAQIETVPLGTYRSREAARAHCEAEARDNGCTPTAWQPFEDEDVEELEGQEASSTAEVSVLLGWQVVAIEVQASYAHGVDE